MRLLRKLWPKSLMARIFVMLALAMLSFLTAGLGMFYRMQFLQHIEDAQDTAGMLLEVAAQAVEESAVIGDYDTVKRTLAKTLVHSPFDSAAFIDLSGGVIRLEAAHDASHSAPAWIEEQTAARLFDVNRPVTVGGKDYGVMRLSFDETRIAAQLWRLVEQAALLALACLVISLTAMGFLLRRWLGHLGKLHLYDAEIASGKMGSETAWLTDAPIEIREAIKAVHRTNTSMRSQFGQRIESLMSSLVQHKSAMDEAAIVCEIDVSGRLGYVNDRFVQSSGYARQELLGRRIDEVGTSSLSGQWEWEALHTVWQGEVMLTGRDRKKQWRRRTIVPIFETEDTIEKYICIDIDITDRKLFEHAILANAKRQNLIASFGQKALEANDIDALCSEVAAAATNGLDTHFSALWFGDAANQRLMMKAGIGWSEDAVGTWFPWNDYRLSDSVADNARHANDINDRGMPFAGIHALPSPLLTQHGIGCGIEVSIFSGARLIGLLGVYAPAERHFAPEDHHFLQTLGNTLATALERHEAKSRLTYLAQFDPLTDLPNRRQLGTCLDDAIAHAAKAAKHVSVMFIDLDRFKNVNDTMGHAVGDALLVQASRRLERCARAGDMVARLGGDEFAVVLHDVTQRSHVGCVAEKIIATLSDPFYLQDQQVFLSASVGIATYPQDGMVADTLLKCADMAMYSAKNLGRNNYQFYLSSMNEDAARRLHTETLLRGALDRNEFMLHFQPKVNLADGNISGLEVLLRWRHPERGLVAPLDFIPILEETGMIIPVGEWVIRQVCEQIKHWQRDGIRLVPVAINLSARQFQQKDLAAMVGAIIDEAAIDAQLLEFELTESMLMSDPEAAVATLTSIKERGIRLSVDDFGTGYSSLAYLKRFPIDALKIDRAFIQDLPADPEDRAITLAVIGLAHSLNLKVVAEGVETNAQIDMLSTNGCDEIQGYYFSKPVGADECTAMLTSGRSLHMAAAAKPLSLLRTLP